MARRSYLQRVAEPLAPGQSGAVRRPAPGARRRAPGYSAKGQNGERTRAQIRNGCRSQIGCGDPIGARHGGRATASPRRRPRCGASGGRLQPPNHGAASDAGQPSMDTFGPRVIQPRICGRGRISDCQRGRRSSDATPAIRSAGDQHPVGDQTRRSRATPRSHWDNRGSNLATACPGSSTAAKPTTADRRALASRPRCCALARLRLALRPESRADRHGALEHA